MAPGLDVACLLTAAADEADDGAERDADLDGAFAELSHLIFPLRQPGRLRESRWFCVARSLGVCGLFTRLLVRTEQDKSSNRANTFWRNKRADRPSTGDQRPQLLQPEQQELFGRQRSAARQAHRVQATWATRTRRRGARLRSRRPAAAAERRPGT